MVIMIKQKQVARTYKEIFGDDFYLEIQNHNMDVEKPILEDMPKIAKELGYKVGCYERLPLY